MPLPAGPSTMLAVLTLSVPGAGGGVEVLVGGGVAVVVGVGPAVLVDGGVAGGDAPLVGGTEPVVGDGKLPAAGEDDTRAAPLADAVGCAEWPGTPEEAPGVAPGGAVLAAGAPP
ncbi:MAG: hypothetical protein ACRDOA_24085 [Streptosporangiaceae bacterium]